MPCGYYPGKYDKKKPKTSTKKTTKKTIKGGRPIPDNVNNPSLYKKARKLADEKYEKHSAYKSGYIVKKYKELGGTYKGSRTRDGLTRWYKEEWKTQRGDTGYKSKSDVYRPTKRISKKTPATFKELSSSEIKRAQKEKKQTGRVCRFQSNKCKAKKKKSTK